MIKYQLMPTNNEIEESGTKKGEVLAEWQAALELAGLDHKNHESLRFLSKGADITVSFAWEILRGKAGVNREQAERIVRACQPLIEARKAKGEIIDL